MKKRSMLAIASLATGFVVAAITPSHANEDGVVKDLRVTDTLGTVDHLVSQESLDLDEGTFGTA
ncbi:hypothetical protein [Streptomyces sp. NPDC026659]|uniref:hypothetical protein n=1 Tax=Streptomyces sp. NPDC026659 TaxID=3155123 RepID=UPI0033CDE238